MLLLLRALIPLALALVMVVLSLIQKVHAEPAMRMPDASDIDAARKSLSSPAEIERAIQERGVSLPRVPGAAVQKGPAPDLSDMAEQYERLKRAQQGQDEGGERAAPGLMVFVSLGMPAESLKRLIADAERARALLVLRGVQGGSLKASAKRIQDLMGEHRVAWQIDPALFQRFEIRAVPTTVLTDPARPVLVACGASQCQQPAFSKASGDVTLEYALSAIEQRDPEFGPLARQYGARLRLQR